MGFSIFQYITRPDDTAEIVFNKKVILTSTLLASVLTLLYAFILTPPSETALWWRKFFIMFVSLGFLLQLLIEKKLRPRLVIGFICFMGLVILVGDLFVVVKNDGNRMWPYYVVLVDICLVCKLNEKVSTFLVCSLILWMGFLASESAFRYGLYDLAFLDTQEHRRSTVDCENLPCPVPVLQSVHVYLSQCFVFLLDFYFTQGFASSLRKEKERMNKVIITTEEIAASLSIFDLTSAESILKDTSLPTPLHKAFLKILTNLKGYRPYLPDALFHSMHSETVYKSSGTPVPGLESRNSTIAFTDIQGSTATWEACPDGMREALQVHNTAIRTCIFENNGYEVKTIGDAFMVAFEEPEHAVMFALSVQESLVNSVWPDELTELESCAWDDVGPWNGLRVRIGLHCGSVEVQLNDLTNRYDYFGNTVNKAARMESACIGGAVAVTPEVFNSLHSLDNITVIPMGETVLKGVGDTTRPFILLPQSLIGRSPFVESQLLLKRKDRKLVMEKADDSQSLPSRGSPMSTVALTQTSSATVACIEINFGAYKQDSDIGILMNVGLAKIFTCTERSHGTVVSLQGGRVAVCWNGAKVCPTHVENSLVFVKMLAVLHEMGKGVTLHVGASTSGISHGTVGVKMQKFITILGLAVVVSGTLCSSAVNSSVLCLFAARFALNKTEGLDISTVGSLTAPDGSTLNLHQVCDVNYVEMLLSSN